MGTTIKKIINFSFYLQIFFFIIPPLYSSEIDLDKARSQFLNGNYKVSIALAENLKSIDAKVFQARAISIYTYFYKSGDDAKSEYIKAYNIAKKAINIDKDNAETYVEAAHALGRYGQEIGIMSAVSEGIAEKVKKYLDKAISINENNIIANLSKGIWHAEIINEAGKTLGRVLYGAKPEMAKRHFKKVYNLNSKEIGLLYELSYGYFLLGEEEDLKISLALINKILNLSPTSHLDSLYMQKAIELKSKIF